ncbi:MAG: hypothetical protein ABJB03_01835 [Rhodoglobus sp.]
MLGYAIAYNSRDFTIDQLTSTTTTARIERIYDQFRSQYVDAKAPPRVYAGPQPYSLVAVNRRGDNAASVTVCYPESEWWIESDHPLPQADLGANGVEITYDVVTEDGALKVGDATESDTSCDASDIALGRFEPAPKPPASISEGDIRPPLTAGP